MLPEFQNAALLDFSRPENEKGMKCALETVRGVGYRLRGA